MYNNNNDITKIEPPKTLAELAALDAARQVPYLKARCNRMLIHIPLPNPTPAEIIPHIQQTLARHLKDPARETGAMSGDFMEWNLIREEYEEFITYLRTLASSAPLNRVNLVNPVHPPSPSSALPPVQPSSTTTRPNPASKTNQSGAPLQTNALYRTESESDPDQKRTEPEPKVEKSSQPIANPSPQNPENQKQGEPTEPPASHAPHAPQPSPLDPEEQRLKRLLAEIPKMTLPQIQQVAAKEFLPDPEKTDFGKYTSAYFDIYGPPPRIRAEKLSPHLQDYIFGLLEQHSFQKVQTALLRPPPFGLYIHTSKSALRRLKLRHQACEAKRNHQTLRQQITTLLSQSDLPEADFARVTDQLLKLRMIESSLAADPDLTQTKTLVGLLEKIRAGKLAERKLALAESKA